MIAVLKLAGLSAALSAGFVTVFEAPRMAEAGKPKIYEDRIAAEAPGRVVFAENANPFATDARAVPPADCRSQTWPYIAQACVRADERTGARSAVRTVTIERRDAPATSTLVRVPVEAPSATR